MMKIPRQEITLTTLSNGLRLVHCHTPKAHSGIFGVAVRAGSADERPDEAGLAHFVEHTIFKGTSKRSSWHIINRMEAVGGELNAFTTKEETVVYSIFPAGAAQRAAELISDLVSNSRFPDAELDKERNVVADEIDSYLDSPSDAVFDDFEDLMFSGRGVGHNILGTRETLAGFDSTACAGWLRRFYVPGNMVAFYSGSQNAGRISAMVEKYFGTMENTAIPQRIETAGSEKKRDAFNVRKTIDSHQAHCVTGIEVPGLYSDSRHAVSLLTNLTGGPGMNSLLNVALRERRGRNIFFDVHRMRNDGRIFRMRSRGQRTMLASDTRRFPSNRRRRTIGFTHRESKKTIYRSDNIGIRQPREQYIGRRTYNTLQRRTI